MPLLFPNSLLFLLKFSGILIPSHNNHLQVKSHLPTFFLFSSLEKSDSAFLIVPQCPFSLTAAASSLIFPPFTPWKRYYDGDPELQFPDPSALSIFIPCLPQTQFSSPVQPVFLLSLLSRLPFSPETPLGLQKALPASPSAFPCKSHFCSGWKETVKWQSRGRQIAMAAHTFGVTSLILMIQGCLLPAD